ncbi:iron-binding zinc finger CDGSH type [Andreesenia angusta]|uniref:Iron-binding zinc finger CDGSH type n=1 Tax=Andreesenia angusta TaxID=39480 RepID=A0A1S1V8J8_9FIRM|nr:CDGSH iron-sulfur domain-containing protein [Andreesenia angusta]OHW62720.1 iron-binding zinc finger CDGSH type [Andreesenia angusta]
MSEKTIKILKNGPYIVSGDIPISERIITPVGKGYVLKDGQKFKAGAVYSLCRCGNSKNAPYCDGSHGDFDGEETASREKFKERVDLCEGQEIDMLDDHRCALARFCHRDTGSAWELVKKSDDPELKEEAIKAAVECPAGRLVVFDKQGNEIEPDYSPEIEVLQDPEKGVSGPLAIKGNIPVVSSDGHVYEIRNRVTLCRCGSSKNKPFCDGRHIRAKFKDGLID